MAFLIKEPGLLSTIQDSGRFGYQSTGISPAGALDYKSAILANQLVNNDPNDSVIELTLTGLSFEVTKNTTIAATGATMTIQVNGVEYPIGRPIPLTKGDFVEFGRATNGLRTYLAVAGGFLLKEVLGSYSTHIRTHMGGYKGRPLEKGDTLHYNGSNNENYFKVSMETLNQSDPTIRIIPGPNYEDLTDESKKSLVEKPYTITRSNDRMGIRLEGETLETKDGVHDILSEPTQLGNIQIPKNGQPIILLNDRQTSGGYKRMASIAKVDLPKLVQLNPDEKIRFEMISLKEAIQLYRDELNKLMNKEYLVNDTGYAFYRRLEAENVQQLLMR